jgi:hypothetical protein
MIGPVFVKLSEQYPDAIFLKVDVDQNAVGAEGNEATAASLQQQSSSRGPAGALGHGMRCTHLQLCPVVLLTVGEQAGQLYYQYRDQLRHACPRNWISPVNCMLWLPIQLALVI